MKHILLKIKQGFKKVIQWLRKIYAKLTRISRPVRPESVPSRGKAAVKKLPIEVSVGESKFYTPPPVEKEKRVYPKPPELPSGYVKDRIVLQVRDPWWIHAYWEISESTWERLRREFPMDFARGCRKVLRVYDVSNIIFTGNNAHRLFDIEIAPDANNWYIDTQGPGRSWCVDLGIRLSDGKFITVVRSNTVSTPLAGPSRITDEEWMIPEDMFARLYGMGIGMGSSPLKLKKLWEERLKREFGSGALSSSSPVKKEKPA
jgi:hypothetical protein